MRNYSALAEIKTDILSGRISCVQLVNHYLNNIEEKKHLNAFLDVYAEEAKAMSIKIDQKIKMGTAGKLAGMIMGLKDVLCYQDHGVQAGSQILKGFKSQFTASAIQRMINEDVIIIGRQNCDEFAMGASNENSSFGPVLNDLAHEYVSGGSSGGSAVAVQAGLCHASIGSDTGGSVRQPAAFTGVVGFKPTYSRISRYGLLAYASSFDTIGTLTHSIEDAALLLEVMAGKDAYDSTVSKREVPAYTQLLDSKRKYKIGYIEEAIHDPALNLEIKEAMLEQIEKLKESGHDVDEVHFPYLDYVVPCYYILTTAESSSNLSRYDGVKYGYRSPKTTNLISMYKKSRSEGFGEEVKRRILLGTFILSASYYDAYYTKAQKVRRIVRDKTCDIFKNHDFIISPTTPTPAFKLGEHTSNPFEMYLADIYTVQASLAGIPAVSLPISKTKEGLPIGFQIMANAFEEEKLFDFSKSIL